MFDEGYGSYSHDMFHKETNMKCDNYGQQRSHQLFHDCFIHEETHKNATRVKFLDRWIRKGSKMFLTWDLSRGQI